MAGWALMRSWGRRIAAALAIVGAVGCGPAAAAGPQVLFLSSFHKDLPAQREFERGLETVLGRGSANGILFEFLDSPRVPAGDAAEGMAALIERKYRSVPLSAVIAWGRPAAEFAATARGRLGRPPTLFVEIADDVAAAVVDRSAGDLVYAGQANYGQSLVEALRLSGPERLVVIGDGTVPTAAVRQAGFKDAVAALGIGLPVEYLVERPLEEVLDRVAQLPPKTMIFYLLSFSDGRGTPMTPYEVAQRISARANAPMFSAWASLMGSGVVGGHVLSIEAAGEDVGAALRALAAGQPVSAPRSAMRLVYDWPQLRRWGWDEASLPPGSAIVNRPPSAWEIYRWEMSLVAASMAALGSLAGFLARAVRSRDAALAALAVERASLAERVTVRTDELARSNAELQQFVYAVSHDLRQPLTAISAYITLIQRALGPTADAEVGHHLAFVGAGAKRMNAMIGGLLDYSRVGHSGRSTQAVDLGVVVAEALDNLQPTIAECGALVTVADGLPTVAGDDLELMRLFQNLIGNAIKYVAPGLRPEVAVDWVAEGEAVRITVADNGIGIAADQRERVFGVFQRLVTQDEYAGTGLGLALCRKIAEHHGGRIRIEDNPGGGSVFAVELPRGAG
ncbi:MAG: hypothetical protein HY985_06435 [Magnetospirillum sp.]|nr:hypothetical protein [Magnetospirillum sp.]